MPAGQKERITRPIRVFHLWFHLNVGGIEMWLLRLAEQLGHKFQLTYYLTDTEGDLAAEARSRGVTVLSPSSPPKGITGHATTLMAVAHAIREFRPDILHVHSEIHLVWAALTNLLNRTHTPIIFHKHGRPYIGKRSIWYWLTRWALGRADAAVYGANHTRQVNEAHYGCVVRKTRIIYAGVPLVHFHASHSPDELRHSLHLPVDATLFVFAGRFVNWIKGIDILIEAAHRLPRDPDWRLLLVGDGPDREKLLQQASTGPNSDRIAWMGVWKWPQLAGLLEACDCYVQASRTEQLGGVLEGMAARLPIVATAVGGVPEAVTHGRTGLLVPPEDPHAFADAMRWILTHPVERRKMGEEGRRIVEAKFATHITMEQIAQLYHEIAASRLAARPSP